MRNVCTSLVLEEGPAAKTVVRAHPRKNAKTGTVSLVRQYVDKRPPAQEFVGRGEPRDADHRRWIQWHQKMTARLAQKSPGVARLVKALLTHGGQTVLTRADDPDLAAVGTRGRFISAQGRALKAMKDHQCHWNTAKLWRAGKVDAIATGYTLSSDKVMWLEHTWGMRGGKVVETTEGNEDAAAYFGITLSRAEAKRFATWAANNPPPGDDE